MSPIPYLMMKQALYQKIAEHYDTAALHLVGAEALAARHAWAAEVVGSCQSVLDFGCGTGTLLCELRGAVGATGRAVGADFSEAMLRVARRKLEAANCHHCLVTLDGSVRLPFKEESFDCITAFGVLQEMATPRAVLEELHRVLRQGGAFRGLATTYRTVNAAAEVHMAAAEQMGVFLRPQNTISTMFLQIFGPAAATRWEANESLTNPEAWEHLPVQPMRAVLEHVRSAGHEPREVELGVLYMTGRKVG